MTELLIPDEVVRMNVAAHGEAGRAWLEALPGAVADLRERWQIGIGPAFGGGVVGFVAPAERPDGKHMVLKISFVEEETRNEADALALWDGAGAVRLLDADRELGALLLERLEPGTSLEAYANRDRAISIACGLLRRLWRPVPDPHPFLLVADVATRWARELPERFAALGAPFERDLVDQAAELCTEFVRLQDEPVLANRDYHLGNVLAAEREPWLLIDPKPLVGEPAFDTGHLLRSLLRDEPDFSSARRIVERLASELGLDSDRIRFWAFIRSVEDALWGLSVGDPSVDWDLRCARVLSTLT
jgi:streptomycin 6-kinase